MSRHLHDRFGLFAPWDRLDPWGRPRRNPRSDPARPQPARPQPARPQPARPEPVRPQPGRPQPAAPPAGSVPTRHRPVGPQQRDERAPQIGDERPLERPVRIVRDLEPVDDGDDPRVRAPAEQRPIERVEPTSPGESHAPRDQPVEAPLARDEAGPSPSDELTRTRLRLEREAERQVEIARRALLSDFIEVLDDLDRALAAGGDSEVTEGVRLVRRRFLDKLARHGARRVEIATGDAFDASSQEAIATVEAGSESRGRVVEVLRPAYFVGDELLRPGQVVVGR